ncbi:carboxypeptidase-like regulatory domain-containing protein [Niabella yanshanensis]|uniref:Carboxypeptidase-like regulatory domain-containing protein n=1 Tax=Niabella yanshanensis TaxID=577386 RepID=A0ABZ0W6F0_9BACT|nr:carboxypeptidase-like regulatory domain-containing protein [Niabella yanshanensis]WQD38766.1 carboxypeptidase-like regulatory domain-containing protein [Niabella yanshanensis]
MKPLYLCIGALFASLLLVACSKADKTAEDGDENPGNETRSPIPYDKLPATSREFTILGPQFYVDLMGRQRPKLPAFKRTNVKPGSLKGHVKDIYGRPLAGAQIGVRSSIIGGSYSSASAISDVNGFYEILLPVGNIEIWGAKYLMDYESAKAPVSLFPADSNLNSFNSTSGAVKNFILLPYGQGRPDEIGKGPYWPSSYLGASIHLSYILRTQSLPLPGSFPVGSIIVISLTPLDLVHADEKISFTIRKVIESTELYINNIPLGRYKIEIKLENGAPVLMRENINLKPQFGMHPKQATGTAQVSFIPGDPEILAWYGNWWIVPIIIEHP